MFGEELDGWLIFLGTLIGGSFLFWWLVSLGLVGWITILVIGLVIWWIIDSCNKDHEQRCRRYWQQRAEQARLDAPYYFTSISGGVFFVRSLFDYYRQRQAEIGERLTEAELRVHIQDTINAQPIVNKPHEDDTAYEAVLSNPQPNPRLAVEEQIRQLIDQAAVQPAPVDPPAIDAAAVERQRLSAELEQFAEQFREEKLAQGFTSEEIDNELDWIRQQHSVV